MDNQASFEETIYNTLRGERSWEEDIGGIKYCTLISTYVLYNPRTGVLMEIHRHEPGIKWAKKAPWVFIDHMKSQDDIPDSTVAKAAEWLSIEVPQHFDTATFWLVASLLARYKEINGKS